MPSFLGFFVERSGCMSRTLFLCLTVNSVVDTATSSQSRHFQTSSIRMFHVEHKA